MEYYLVWPMSDNPGRADEQWLKKTIKNKCGHRSPKSGRLDLDIVLAERGDDVPYCFTHRGHFEYVRDDFLSALQPYADKALKYGSVSDTNGSAFEHLRSIATNNIVWMRGGRNSYCWRCPVCRTICYDPLGKWYIIENQIPDVPLFKSHYGGIIVESVVCKRLQKRKWPKVKIERLTIYDHSVDGFPDDLNTITPSQERRDE